MEVSHYSNCLQMNEIRFRKFVLFAYWRSYRIDLKHVKSHAGIWLTTNEEGKWERERESKKKIEQKNRSCSFDSFNFDTVRRLCLSDYSLARRTFFLCLPLSFSCLFIRSM